MQVIPYLFFNGNCAEAMETYARILGGKITQKFPASAAPAEIPVPDDRKDWVMHSELTVDDRRIFASDDIMGESPPMAGTSIMLGFKTVDEGKRVFDELADGGAVSMPFGPTFWSAGFAAFTDRFGTRWMIDCEEPRPN